MATTPSTLVVTVTPQTPPQSPVSPKVIASTVATLVVSLLVACVTALVNDPATLASLLDAVPPWLRFVIVATLPTAATYLAGYVKRDSVREIGAAAVDALTKPRPDGEPDHEPASPEHEAAYGVPATDSDPAQATASVAPLPYSADTKAEAAYHAPAPEPSPEPSDEFSGTTQEDERAQ